MLAIAFTFPAGRYHATPWGRHVNEADVAWPPDLWRITRALIAVWHRKLDPARFPRERLHELLARLAAAEPPSFRLPESVIHAHSRHYMPGKGDKRTLVFDAFARVADDDPVVIVWSGLALDAPQTEVLDALLENLGFLGRAESWVDARRATAPEDFNCVPAAESVDPETGEVTGEIVRLMAPSTPEIYRAFRSGKLEAAGIKLEPAGRPPKLKPDQKKLLTTLPEDWLNAIGVETGELQAAGWSAPPCARTVSYRRPLHALKTTAPKVVCKPAIIRPNAPITTARFALYAKPLPRITDAVRVGENLRIAAMGRARRLFGEGITASLSGHDLPASNRHGHAFFLCEKNENGCVDHVVIHAPDGFDAQAQAALAELKNIHTREGAEWRLLLEGLGEAKDFPGFLLAEANCWESVTPYLHPWHRKKGFDVAEQIARECRLRGLAEPVTVETLPEVKPRALDFRRFRTKRGLQQPDRQGHFLRLVFLGPIAGPLALGFG
ncbi:MAG: type I-U CRISPR-associated protein Csb2, partial [Prosthecobacter sp.]|nr:type I-U CRISPR-associated protein Csb2 [Prosthecobacter sp.]